MIRSAQRLRRHNPASAVRCETSRTLQARAFTFLSKVMLVGTVLGAAHPGHAQGVYPSAQAAAEALQNALATHDPDGLKKVLGADYRRYTPVESIDMDDVYAFLSAYAKHHQIIHDDQVTAHLEVGDSGWTLPVPIKRTAAGWHFDTAQARTELTVRRIGRNELAAIQTVLAIGDAQRDFARAKGETVYARRFISHPDRRDGLYWPTSEGDPESPLGALAADMDPTAPPGEAYHGYHYRILTAQGVDAPGGAKSYVSDGKMTGGFAVIAWPARYGDSGVMTFISSADGKVYQRNLGPQTASVVPRINRYNPDSEWQPVPDSQLVKQ